IKPANIETNDSAAENTENRIGAPSCSARSVSSVAVVTKLVVSMLSPLALQRESGPKIRRLPLRISPHFDLRRAERRRGSRALFQQPPLKPRHHFRSGFVIDVPEADHDAGRAGVHKSARQTD